MAMVYRLRPPAEVVPAKQANPPTLLPRAPKTPEVLIAKRRRTLDHSGPSFSKSAHPRSLNRSGSSWAADGDLG